MKSLAIDTSSNFLSLALFNDSDLIVLQQLNIGRQHGEYLIPAVRNLLDQVNWQPQDLTRLYIGQGPGSYTGIRIGVTMVKTWAKALKIEVYALSSLALMASQSYSPAETKSLLVPVIDARRGTAYTGAYAWRKQGDSTSLQSLIEDQHIDWQNWVETQLFQLIDHQQIKELVFIGQAIGDLIDTVEASLKDKKVSYSIIDSHKTWPAVENALLIENNLVKDIDIFVPYYAHQSLAEQEWEKSQETQTKEETNEGFIEHFYETDTKS